MPVSTIISTIIEFQMAFDSATRTCSKAVFLCSRYSILADQLFQPVGSLLLHVLVAVTIDVKGEGDCRMAQRFGQGLRIDVALQEQRGECVANIMETYLDLGVLRLLATCGDDFLIKDSYP